MPLGFPKKPAYTLRGLIHSAREQRRKKRERREFLAANPGGVSYRSPR